MKRWMIVHNNHLKAAEKAVAAIEPYLDYVPVCAENYNSEFNPVYLKIDENVKGIKIFISEPEGESQYIEIVGHDEIYLLYAIADFKNVYLPFAHHSDTSNAPYFFNKLFQFFKAFFNVGKPLNKLNLSVSIRIASNIS